MTAVTGKIGIEEYVDNFLAENSALRRKLQSKAEALLILSKELDQCRTERDQFKLMAEQLQDRYSMLKKQSHDMGFSCSLFYTDGIDTNRPGNSLAQILGETKEQNKALRIEVEDLRQKLRDAQGDIKALRMRLGQQRAGTNTGDSQAFPAHQREELVQQLETLSIKCTQLGADLQAVLDEKEELVTERDAYKCKVHRLNHELNTLLKGDSKKVVDIDALVMENRYLQERLQQAEEEKDMSIQALTKYKSMLDKKRTKGTVKLGTNNNTGMVMSHKQGESFLQQLLERGTSAQLPNTAATLSDMKSLCLALLEALGDKTLALTHQKKANRILASRIADLEQTVQGGRVAAFPSQLLLEGYASSEVDRDMNRLLSPEQQDGSDSEGDCVASIHLDSQSSGLLTDCFRYAGVLCSTENGVETEIVVTDGVEVSKRPSSRHKPSQPLDDKGRGLQDSGTHCIGTVGHDDSLPPQLQQLVEKALEEMKQEAKKAC